MTNEEIIKVVSAAKAGKPIEFKYKRPHDKWVIHPGNPSWNFESFDYRVQRVKLKPNTVPEIVELLRAEREGKPIECSSLQNNEDEESGWLIKIGDPINFHFDVLRYRIKNK